jgi:DNA-3-methyladenine glycosylase II
MVASTDYTKARRHLMRRDPRLATIIKRVGTFNLASVPPQPPFTALTYSIASQQLSVKAADTIFKRFCALFPEQVPDPVYLLTLHDDAIRGVGFSRPKVGFLKDLAAQVVDHRLPLDELHLRSDEDVIAALTAVKGIGRWTAEVYLLFRLRRPDIFPADDLGLIKAVQQTYGMRKRPSRTRLLEVAESWRPYRSVAAWYLWRSLGVLKDESKRENEKRKT